MEFEKKHNKSMQRNAVHFQIEMNIQAKTKLRNLEELIKS